MTEWINDAVTIGFMISLVIVGIYVNNRLDVFFKWANKKLGINENEKENERRETKAK